MSLSDIDILIILAYKKYQTARDWRPPTDPSYYEDYPSFIERVALGEERYYAVTGEKRYVSPQETPSGQPRKPADDMHAPTYPTCPQCGVETKKTDSTYRCPKCGATYEFKEGKWQWRYPTTTPTTVTKPTVQEPPPSSIEPATMPPQEQSAPSQTGSTTWQFGSQPGKEK